jgi:hypothetical protein
MPKNNEEVQRDFAAYRDWMLKKALKTGMTDVEARTWAQEQANLQITLRQRELEERQLRHAKKKR